MWVSYHDPDSCEIPSSKCRLGHHLGRGLAGHLTGIGITVTHPVRRPARLGVPETVRKILIGAVPDKASDIRGARGTSYRIRSIYHSRVVSRESSYIGAGRRGSVPPAVTITDSCAGTAIEPRESPYIIPGAGDITGGKTSLERLRGIIAADETAHPNSSVHRTRSLAVPYIAVNILADKTPCIRLSCHVTRSI